MWTDDQLPPRSEFLTIGEGSEWETVVVDVRRYKRWSTPSGTPVVSPPRLVVWHHTVGPVTDGPPESVVDHMYAEANSAQYGLPYNFLVNGGANPTIFYLNDVDQAWPHTYGHNGDAVAICAAGNWESQEPPDALVDAMWRLSHALMVMWGEVLPIQGHRETYATACPGKYLFARLTALRTDGQT